MYEHCYPTTGKGTCIGKRWLNPYTSSHPHLHLYGQQFDNSLTLSENWNMYIHTSSLPCYNLSGSCFFSNFSVKLPIYKITNKTLYYNKGHS